MENATQALLMAGAILIGILILALGVYIVNNMQGVDTAYDVRMSTQEILKFNQEILKNLEYTPDSTESKYTATPQQLITINNLTREYEGKVSISTNAETIIDGRTDAEFLREELLVTGSDGSITRYKVTITNDERGQISVVNFG